MKFINRISLYEWVGEGVSFKNWYGLVYIDHFRGEALTCIVPFNLIIRFAIKLYEYIIFPKWIKLRLEKSQIEFIKKHIEKTKCE